MVEIDFHERNQFSMSDFAKSICESSTLERVVQKESIDAFRHFSRPSRDPATMFRR